MFAFVVAFILTIISVFWFFARRNGKSSKQQWKIPGVTPSDAELGNLTDVGRAGSLHQYLTQLHEKFGPVVSFYWNKQRVVSIASPESFHDTRRLFDRPVPLFAPFEPLIGAHSIQYANGENGQYRRKNHYDVALSRMALRSHLFEGFQTVLRKKLLTYQTKIDKPVALHAEMTAISIQAITLATFGSSKLSDSEEHIHQAYNKCMHEMEMRIQGHLPDEKGDGEFKQALDYMHKKIKEVIAERRERSGYDDKCFVDYLLADDTNAISEEQICDDVISTFVGGFHTTGNLLTWALYFLAKNQSVQDRLADELVQNLDTDCPSMEQIDQLSYLNSVINESLRLSVVAPWAARICFDEDILVCGFTIPAGTPIIQALGVILHDDKLWPNPHEFNPDRFHPDEKNKIPALAFAPFGFAGKRVCPGYQFAHYEASLFLGGIVRAYKVILADPASPVVPVYGLVTTPQDEIFVHFQPREH